jgi:hypothetical protein
MATPPEVDPKTKKPVKVETVYPKRKGAKTSADKK